MVFYIFIRRHMPVTALSATPAIDDHCPSAVFFKTRFYYGLSESFLEIRFDLIRS